MRRRQVRRGSAAKYLRMRAAVQRAFESYHTYTDDGYLRMAPPEEFVPKGLTVDLVLPQR